MSRTACFKPSKPRSIDEHLRVESVVVARGRPSELACSSIAVLTAMSTLCETAHEQSRAKVARQDNRTCRRKAFVQNTERVGSAVTPAIWFTDTVPAVRSPLESFKLFSRRTGFWTHLLQKRGVVLERRLACFSEVFGSHV
jgi:hypothetical protein